ncbi:helix-turn-helix domain-containing protein [Actinomadura sp. 21ATH]|uniref:helix-turn-helix domain-containing protein n=1 Tax=Actinomadura sp. 21ATH TaxID=1735444 RepID=UPI0035C16C5C
MPQIEATPLTVHWGKRIRMARQKRELSLNAMARMLEIDAGNLSRVERGLQRLSDEMRVRVATGLGERVDELFAHPEPDDQPAKQDA